MIQPRHALCSEWVELDQRQSRNDKRRPMAAFFYYELMLLFHSFDVGMELQEFFIDVLVAAVNVIET
jgi:hypothetical protein